MGPNGESISEPQVLDNFWHPFWAVVQQRDFSLFVHPGCQVLKLQIFTKGTRGETSHSLSLLQFALYIYVSGRTHSQKSDEVTQR